MSEHVLIALIAAAGSIVSASIAAITMALTRTLDRKVNGRMDQLLEEARKVAALEVQLARELRQRME